MSSHKHGRERDGHVGSSSTRYYKGDHYALPKKRISTTTGSSRNYASHSSGDRYYEEKKLHGHSGSSYHPYSSSTTTSSHRPQLSRSSGGNNYGGSGGDHHRYGGVVQRDSRKILKVDYGRKHYEKSSTSGIRRIPPPLSPPPPPLMKLPVPSSSASRYRQAPPEDRYQNQRSSHKEIHRSSTHETASYVKRERVEDDRKSRKVTEKARPRKRVIEADVKSGSPVETKKKKEKDDAEPEGEEIVEEEIAGDDEEINTEKEKEKEEKSEKEEEKKEKRDEKEKDTKALLKLVCTYCDVRCVTFKDFTNHLRSFQHLKAMSAFVAETKRKLYTLKKAARDQQKEMEKTMDAAQKTLSDTSSYCRVCELDLRTDPKEHEDNEIHNEIKTIIHRKCEICDVDFRFWKVYVYHTVALEHVKRVALQDLKEKEARGENIKGTNLTLEELGMDLLEEKNVFYCKACVRYFPIREDLEDTKMRHCMSLGHIKYVEEYRNRLKWLKKREEADARDKLEAEKRREKKLKEEEEKKKEEEKEGSGKEAEGEAEDGEKTTSEIGVDVKEENEHQPSDEEKDEATENHEEEDEKDEHDEPPPPEDDQDDEDEIQLHAEADESVEALDGDDDDEEDE